MSVAISAIPGPADFNQTEAKAIPKPTIAQETQTLASTGLSVLQIATALGLTTAEVNSTLGIKTSSTSAATAVPAGLSVHV
jgi:hypothetical protein